MIYQGPFSRIFWPNQGFSAELLFVLLAEPLFTQRLTAGENLLLTCALYPSLLWPLNPQQCSPTFLLSLCSIHNPFPFSFIQPLFSHTNPASSAVVPCSWCSYLPRNLFPDALILKDTPIYGNIGGTFLCSKQRVMYALLVCTSVLICIPPTPHTLDFLDLNCIGNGWNITIEGLNQIDKREVESCVSKSVANHEKGSNKG